MLSRFLILCLRGWILEGTVNAAAAAVLLVMMTPTGLAAEPRVLGEPELDGVTAAGVFVGVDSVAAALGDRTFVFTDSRTVTIPGTWFDLGIGLTLGQGYACCGEAADVAVGSTAVGAGDIVRQGTRQSSRDDGVLAQGLSAAFVVTVSLKQPLLSHSTRPAVPAVRTELRDSGGD
jgi:hypothetical protein